MTSRLLKTFCSWFDWLTTNGCNSSTSINYPFALSLSKGDNRLIQHPARDAFGASRLHQLAVVKALEIVGEAAGKVSQQFQQSHPQITWQDIVGMRHRRVHGYSQLRRRVGNHMHQRSRVGSPVDAPRPA